MKKITLLLLCLLLSACAIQKQAPEQLTPADETWQTMLNMNADAQQPFKAQLSMRVGREGETRRITAILWGNTDDNLRLDVMAGIGAIFAKISENGNDFRLYLPRENKAYFHTGSNRPLFKLGLPLPFDLFQLASLINGNFKAAFGMSYTGVSIAKNGNFVFELEKPLGGTLELDAAARPVAWQQRGGGWNLKLSYDDASTMPKSLRLGNADGHMAIILVKERETLQTPFKENQLRLEFPGGVTPRPLSELKSI